MTLAEAKAGERHLIVRLATDLKLRQKLEAMGLVPGQGVNVINSTGAGKVVEVKHSRLAIGMDLAKLMEIE
ncbi:MAG: ferrous iron transport protein A [Coriobacteriales bacterium]|jgi:ferrous iron transport protein A|nr:ferrous iron transport protein A [Coriobacteriales bacterium]